ncbi:MAG: radical SAM/SPASM domain-containing protein [Kiritimatiellae bacterium]|jgi:MoaA/NifB/PqqE/SkfB family radical SAM enzyme|nr:radical SAM/SPASM domain-containing protein [Kiritimatiellia bacterium]
MTNKKNKPLALRFLTGIKPRLLFKFVFGAGVGNMLAIRAFEKRKKRGVVFPPFVFVSITQRCNLKCRGCWAIGAENPVDMSREMLNHLVAGSRKQGCRFFGILGGEPLLIDWLPEFFKENRKSYFQLLTNGHLLTEEKAAQFAQAGNVSPLVSIEGWNQSYAERRGSGSGFEKALNALELCKTHGLITGVATSVSNGNFNDVVKSRFVEEMVSRGAHYVWFYIYRPSGQDPNFEDALNDDQVRELRQFMVDERKRCKSAVIVDSYWDEKGEAVCPGAMGVSHHINAMGDVEPCPPIQCSDCHLTVESDVAEAITGSKLLEDFREKIPELTRGCVLMDHPEELSQLAKAHGAIDSSGRGTFYKELAERTPMSCHDHSGDPIPETNLSYKLAKKYWFFGFGAYS